MLDEKLRKAILKRINKIPIVDTLQLEVVALSEGYCQVKVTRKLGYDGIFEPAIASPFPVACCAVSERIK